MPGWLALLDRFQRPASDFSEPTVGGAVATLLLWLATIGVVAYELSSWSIPTLTTTMVVRNHWDDMLRLSLDFDVKIPCPLVSVEVYDEKASHMVDIQRKLERRRLTAHGDALPTEGAKQEHVRMTGADAITGPGDPDSETLFGELDRNRDGYIDDGEVPAAALDVVESAANRAVADGVHRTVGTAAFDKDHKISLAEYLAAGGFPQLKEHRPTSTVSTKVVQQMLTDNEWCKVLGDILVPAVPADLVISTAYDLDLQQAAYRKHPNGAVGVNTSHIIHRMNFVNPKSNLPLADISAWGGGWWTRRLVGFGAIKEPEVQQQQQKPTVLFNNRAHDIVKDPYGQSSADPFKNVKRKLNLNLGVNFGILEGIQDLFRTFHRSNHSLDKMVQVMDLDRIQFHYETSVVGVENADGVVSYKSTSAQSHFQLSSASNAEPEIRISYSVAPVMISYGKKFKSVFDLVFRVLAMVGGLCAVASLFEGSIYSIHMLIKKRSGKFI